MATKRTSTRKRVARYVSTFGHGMRRGWTTDRELLGGKGAGLAVMSEIDLPVPPGLTITTEVCTRISGGAGYPDELEDQVEAALRGLEKAMGRRFGDPEQPLLVSVRSGARVSMPGMMDTVLNLGLNHRTVEGLARASGDARFAWDSYRRFVSMYGDVVLGLPLADFEHLLEKEKKRRKVAGDHELDADSQRRVTEQSLALVEERLGEPFPAEPKEQLWGAVDAVFRSWDNDRAIAYRRMNDIPDDWGTAVNVQAMVFGNLGAESGTGVAFTRNPATGAREFYGEFLLNAQGEDVVAGIRTPQPIDELKRVMPGIHARLLEIRKILEERFTDMQDLEFTFEQGRLFILQTRAGKRTGRAAVRIATDLVRERKLTKEQALAMVPPDSITQLMSPVFAGTQKQRAVDEGRLLATGLNAGPGAASGRIVFTAEAAVEEAARSAEPVLLIRNETSPEDIRGMEASAGILTARGGMTSHAALVARQMGKVCVAGCGALQIDARRKRLVVENESFKEGDWLSIDGTTGEVIAGKLETADSEIMQVLRGDSRPSRDGDDARFRRLMKWADEARRLAVRANADQPDQAATAVALGAEGIGLCRTEHMFFGEGKLDAVQRMILAEDPEQRRAALEVVLPLQQRDFEGIFRAMGSRPVTIRTLDPPLHEFLPHDRAGAKEMAERLGVPLRRVRKRIASLEETNPMLGMRGCRLTLLAPEILEVQVRAILRAASVVLGEGTRVRPEIMIPLAGHREELRPHAEITHRIAAEVRADTGRKVPYTVGTMIEIPRAALTADQVAEVAEFFSFGTNDLTQTTLGISRDDSALFLPAYVERRIYDRDPFATIDRDGVGRLMRWAVERGRAARPDLKIGICGEHGGDSSSIDFCEELALDYVSCSPFRIPVARLAAAQAVLRRAAEAGPPPRSNARPRRTKRRRSSRA